jgi:hypothetical protein
MGTEPHIHAKINPSGSAPVMNPDFWPTPVHIVASNELPRVKITFYLTT